VKLFEKLCCKSSGAKQYIKIHRICSNVYKFLGVTGRNVLSSWSARAGTASCGTLSENW